MPDCQTLALAPPSELQALGFAYYQNEFLPWLEQLQDDPATAAAGWSTVGVLHAMHEAPRAAEDTFRRALAFYDQLSGHEAETGETWAELGDCLARQGRAEEAENAYAMALELFPELYIFNLEQDSEYLAEDEPYSEIAELLATGQAYIALGRLSGDDDADAIRWRACVYGALGDTDRYLEELTSLSDTALTAADWFYRPPGIADVFQYWEILKSMSGVLDTPASMDEWCQDDDQRRALTCEYHIARCTGDEATLQALRERYPAWTELHA